MKYQVKLNLGCGPNVFAGWVNIDKEDMTNYLLFLANPNTDMGKMPPEQRKLADQFSYTIVNDELERAIDELESVVNAELAASRT